MSTPDTCVYDLTPPRRPGLDDVGGGAKEDDQEWPPNPLTDLTGDDLNQYSNLHVRHGAVVPLAVLSIHFSGGTPSISKVSSVIASVTASAGVPFTLTDNSDSDTTISWPADTFPTAVADHDARVTGATVGTIAAETLTNSVRVRTSGTDLPFNLYIY